MDKLLFYRIEQKYLDYLKTYDNQVPNNVEKGHAKPFCGIVYEINEFKYYAPISSFNIPQKTNFPIYDNGIIISSIRFCFMIPILNESVLTYLDFSKEDKLYSNLLESEYRYIKNNVDEVYKKAENTYKIGSNRKHPLAYTCCDFKLLEKNMPGYIQLQETIKEVAQDESMQAKEQVAPTEDKLRE